MSQANLGRRDYRVMHGPSATAKDTVDLRTFERAHLGEAEGYIRQGRLQDGVMHNLHFVLRRVPNHPRGLDLLLKWANAGGRDAEYQPPQCYLEWARSFAPDDVVVWNSSGFFYWKSGNVSLAQQYWEKALEVAPQSAEINYNLGLAYFETGDYPRSAERARVAYSLGYPLPGLREKLMSSGHWLD